MIKLIRKVTKAEVMEIFIPEPINVRGCVIAGGLRVAKISESIKTSNLSIDQTKMVGYEFLYNKEWVKLDKQNYDKLRKLSRGWGLSSVGSFTRKKDSGIIGISFK